MIKVVNLANDNVFIYISEMKMLIQLDIKNVEDQFEYFNHANCVRRLT